MSTVDMHGFSAGDYTLSEMRLYGQNLPYKNIRNNVMELNIYESIDSPMMSGNIILRDGFNHRQNMGLTGQEEIEFTLQTNDKTDIIDFKTFRGRVYKIDKIIGTTDNQQIYTIHFISMEGMRNIQNKVLSAYSGSSDEIVTRILSDVINTKKPLFIQNSTNFQKVLGNTMYPFEFIDMLSRRSSKGSTHGFVFYENHKGYNFHSWDGFAMDFNGVDREPVESFFNTQSYEKTDTITEMRSLRDFAILRTQDTLRDYSDGLLAATHTAYDRLNKTQTNTEYNYITQHESTPHIDGPNPLYTRTPEQPYKTLYDYVLANRSVTTSDPSLHVQSATDERNYDNNSTNLTKRNMRALSAESLRIKIQVHGNSSLAAGSLIHVDLPNYEPLTQQRDDRVHDLYMSGKYVIAQINHKVSPTGYVSICECIKDSVSVGYEESPFTIEENIKEVI